MPILNLSMLVIFNYYTIKFTSLGQYIIPANQNQNDVYVGEWRTGKRYGYGTIKLVLQIMAHRCPNKLIFLTISEI